MCCCAIETVHLTINKQNFEERKNDLQNSKKQRRKNRRFSQNRSMDNSRKSANWGGKIAEKLYAWLFYWKLTKFAIIWCSWTFLAVSFFNSRLFSTLTLLFCQKSTKFSTNYQNIDFTHGWYFFTFFKYKYVVILLKIGKIYDLL